MTADEPLPSRDMVFLDRDTLPDGIALKPFSFNHRLSSHPGTEPHQVAERIAAAEIVITNKVPIDAAAIAGATRLKLIAVCATGTNMVDVAAATTRGIAVCNVRNYAVHSVPEHTFALMLALRRSVVAYRQSVADGRWQQSKQFCFFDHPIRDLAGSTLGIIGGGALGRAVADIASAFGMMVLFADCKGATNRGRPYTPFAEVLARSDVITLHAPLLPSTRHLIGRDEFALMARRPLLINTARGGLVDEMALHDALVSGQIAGAGFDVVTAEPPPPDHIMMQLLDLPNFILTPHVAWASREAIQALADQMVENVELFVAGRPRHLVTA